MNIAAYEDEQNDIQHLFEECFVSHDENGVEYDDDDEEEEEENVDLMLNNNNTEQQIST